MNHSEKEHIADATQATMSRRNALQLLGRGALAGSVLSSSLLAMSPDVAFAQGKTPRTSKDSPSLARNAEVYRFEIGDIEAFAVADGAGSFPLSMWEKDRAEVARTLKENFRPINQVQIFFQFLVLRYRNETVAIDAGFGSSPLRLPSTGRWLHNLRAVGIAPENITAAIITHAHPDHISGFLDARKRPLLPHAAHYIAPTERRFWLNSPDLSHAPGSRELKHSLVVAAQTGLDALRSQLQPLGASRLFGMIEALPVPGHTPGMRALRIQSRGQTLVHMADIAHNDVLNLRHPGWLTAFDTNERQGAETRRRFLHQLASERVLSFANHLPFPGLGYVRGTPTGFEWVPQAWKF